MLEERRIAIYQGAPHYATAAPFHPATVFPEAPFPLTGYEPNPAYAGVRSAFALLGLDEHRFGTALWNPLGALVRPGDHVVLKPNFIAHGRQERTAEWLQIVTHPSVIRAVLDYVYLALQGVGRVTIIDGPQADSDFDEIRRRTSLDALAAFFNARGLNVAIVDLRPEKRHQKQGVTAARDRLAGDPAGYTRIQLDGSSEFTGYALNGRFYGADYDMADTAAFHHGSHHSYVLSRTVLGADVLINLPKMKTHKKAGVTLSLKNMVGINGYRNCLPHHTVGTPEEGGDEFPFTSLSNRVQSRGIVAVKRVLAAQKGCGGFVPRLAFAAGRHIFGDTARVVRSGNWYGNDTMWRTVLDLNKALFHFDERGEVRSKPLRYLSVVDGIVAGDGDGPVAADAKPCGVIVAGANPIAVDTVCAVIMGLDYEKIRCLERAWSVQSLPLVSSTRADLQITSNVPEWQGGLNALTTAGHLAFRPHFGWRNAIERTARTSDWNGQGRATALYGDVNA